MLSIPYRIRWTGTLAAIFWAVLTGGCRPQAHQPVPTPKVSLSALEPVDIAAPSHVEPWTEAVQLATPRAGWSDFQVRVALPSNGARATLRLPAFAKSPRVSAVGAYQVLSAPVDFDTAAYVRQSGDRGGVRAVPRVLLPLPVRADGTVDLAGLRKDDPVARGSALLWIEVRAADRAPAGAVAGTCDLADVATGAVLGSVPVSLTVVDLTLPAERHLHIAAPLDWSALSALHPADFAGVAPRLLSRHDSSAAAALADLDAALRLAHENRTGLYVDQLQPIVKWQPLKPPAVDWADFDAVAGPWLDGSAFADRQPVGYWPLPSPESLDSFDLAARTQFWAQAATHFDRQRWTATGEHPVVLHPDAPAGPITEADQIILSAEARAALDAAPGLHALLPLQIEQLKLATASDASLIAPATGDRLLARAAGDVRRVPRTPVWPPTAPPPAVYLDAGNPAGDSPVLHGTGDEQDVRSTGWLAFLRGAGVVTCGRPLPSAASPATPVRADELPWFYPGSWYGADGLLPTVQLKWLRQAEQDYEVLRLSAEGGDADAARAVCRLVTKPVDIPAGDAAAAVSSEVSLLGGTIDPHACQSTRDLLIDRLVSHRSGGSAAAAAAGLTQLDLRTVRWFNAHQRPTAFATAVRWTWSDAAADLMGQLSDPAEAGPGSWITARVNVNVYDPADPLDAPADPAAGHRAGTWSGNTLQWQTAGGGWEPHPPTTYVPVIPACSVRPMTALARYNLERASPAPAIVASESADVRPPLALTLLDGADGQTVDCPLVLPVATCDRLTRPVTLDGNLNDWVATDAAVLDRPLVRMSSRPAVQAGDARPADHPSSVYTGWTDDDLYLAFRVAGVTPDGTRSARNFVEYRDGRAWGEDLCEATVQAVYVDDTVGPALHVVCKPGGEWVERQPAAGGDWQPFEGAALRYATTVAPPTRTWHGELAIPWQSLVLPGRGRPSLLRFNFGQHTNATGESATWAGPVDHSRQTGLAGLLVLRGATN